MRRVISPALRDHPGQPAFEVYKNLQGGTAIRVHDKVVQLSPREGCDLAVVLLRIQGVRTDDVEARIGEAMGAALRAGAKIIF